MVERLKRARRAILGAYVIIILSGIAAITCVVWVPIDGMEATDLTGVEPDGASTKSSGTDLLDAYACIYQRDLRRPVIDPKATPAPTPPPPKLTAVLIGTATDPDYTCAFFRLTSGEVTTVGVGQQIEQGKVTHIGEGKVTVVLAGQTLHLTSEGGSGRP